MATVNNKVPSLSSKLKTVKLYNNATRHYELMNVNPLQKVMNMKGLDISQATSFPVEK